jgi:hypothetical protein
MALAPALPGAARDPGAPPRPDLIPRPDELPCPVPWARLGPMPCRGAAFPTVARSPSPLPARRTARPRLADAASPPRDPGAPASPRSGRGVSAPHGAAPCVRPRPQPIAPASRPAPARPAPAMARSGLGALAAARPLPLHDMAPTQRGFGSRGHDAPAPFATRQRGLARAWCFGTTRRAPTRSSTPRRAHLPPAPCILCALSTLFISINGNSI